MAEMAVILYGWVPHRVVSFKSSNLSHDLNHSKKITGLNFFLNLGFIHAFLQFGCDLIHNNVKL